MARYEITNGQGNRRFEYCFAMCNSNSSTATTTITEMCEVAAGIIINHIRDPSKNVEPFSYSKLDGLRFIGFSCYHSAPTNVILCKKSSDLLVFLLTDCWLWKVVKQ